MVRQGEMMNGCEATIGRATVRFSIDADPTAQYSEGQGLAEMEFATADVDRFGGIDAGSYRMDGKRIGYPLGDLLREAYDDDETDTVVCSDADACIVMLAAMGHAGGTYDVAFSSEGSAFWLFHDLAHARYDVEYDDVSADGVPGDLTISQISDVAEQRAHVQGGLAALRAGMPLAEVISEIVRNGPAFADRFGGECWALSDLLDSLTVTVPAE